MLSGLRRSSPDDHIIALWCADNCLGVRTTLWNKPLAAIPIWATILLGNNMWWMEDVAIHLLIGSSQLAFIEYEMRKVCCPCVLLIVSQWRLFKTLILYLTRRNGFESLAVSRQKGRMQPESKGWISASAEGNTRGSFSIYEPRITNHHIWWSNLIQKVQQWSSCNTRTYKCKFTV